MRSTPILRFMGCLGSAALLAACGGSGSGSSGSDDTACSAASSFPSTPLATVASKSGKLQVNVHSAPVQPLVAGLQCVELVITDPSTGSTRDGLTVSMTPWMPAMGHGSSVTPQVTPLGQGRYVFTNVSLPMSGEWQLQTTIAGASAEEDDSVDPTFSVD